MNQRRFEELAIFKQKTRIGIFGSFFENYKKDLTDLQHYLHDILGYDARISENLEKDFPRSNQDKYIRDYSLSELLIEDSHIHILIFPFPKDTDPHHLNQSASIEYTMIRERKKPYVVVLVEKGLQKNIRDSFGGVMKGSLQIDTAGLEYEIIEYNIIGDSYSELTMICYRFMRKICKTRFH